jgi:hypothetical protein
MPERKRPQRRFRAPVPPRAADGEAVEASLAFLDDPDAFLRRFVLSLALEPPPSLRRLRRR